MCFSKNPRLKNRARVYCSKLGFYGCTVPSFEQYTLARFLSRGYFEKHINRMRKYYKSRRNQLLSRIRSWEYADRLLIYEQDAGLHFILKAETELSDRELTDRLRQAGLSFRCLTDYYHERGREDLHCLVVNYGALGDENLEQMLSVLAGIFQNPQDK